LSFLPDLSPGDDLSEIDIEATALRYFEVHGQWAWLEVSLIADRHYAQGNMALFRDWARVAKRVNELLPWADVAE
jgi:hypothetical protein